MILYVFINYNKHYFKITNPFISIFKVLKTHFMIK